MTEAAQAVTSFSAAAQVAQKTLSSMTTAADSAKALFCAADGSVHSLDQLMNGPLFPKALELYTLRESAELLFDIPGSRALSALADHRLDQLLRELSPAEIVQIAFRPEPEFTAMDFSLPMRLVAPGSAEIEFADLLHIPLYPSVNERFSWMERAHELAFHQQERALASFCWKKADLLKEAMSEAEAVQLAFVQCGQRARPAISLALPEQFADASGNLWTLAQLKEQPLTQATGVLEEIFSHEMSCYCEGTGSLAEQARLAVEEYAVALRVPGLMSQLSDAELMQLCLAMEN